MRDVARDREQCGLTTISDGARVQLGPAALVAGVDELGLERLGVLATTGRKIVDAPAHCCTVGRAQQIGHRLVDQRVCRQPKNVRSRIVGVEYRLVVNDRELRQQFGQCRKQIPRFTGRGSQAAVEVVDGCRDFSEAAGQCCSVEGLLAGLTGELSDCIGQISSGRIQRSACLQRDEQRDERDTRRS